MKSIIFISGFGVPEFVARSKFLWDEPFWSDYTCFWLGSRTPTSDRMVEKELDRLERILSRYPDSTVAGQSLGAWWAANLALRSTVDIKKLVFWTGLCNHNEYPIFNATPRYNPVYQESTNQNFGVHRVLNVYAKDDLIVPPQSHAFQLNKQFCPMPYQLEGGHLLQRNHKEALSFMKDWIERK
jgi:hypothetical protein